jgi:hypothetical protein
MDINQYNMENNNFEMHDIEQMTPYQVFVSSLFRMGRDSKLLRRNCIRQQQMPMIRLVTLRGKRVDICYLADSNIWATSEQDSPWFHFNPTTYTGILDFMLDYDGKQLKDACISMCIETEKILRENAIERLRGAPNSKSMAS